MSIDKHPNKNNLSTICDNSYKIRCYLKTYRLIQRKAFAKKQGFLNIVIFTEKNGSYLYRMAGDSFHKNE